MATSDNLLSLRNPNVITFNIYRNLRRNTQKASLHKANALKCDNDSSVGLQMLQTIHLRKRWLELKDREYAARQFNRELLQQFDKAQDTLREMIAATASMKTIRMEYDLFLEESASHRQQEHKEKTQVHHEKRMEQCLKMCLKKEEQVSKSIGKHLYSSGCSSQAQRNGSTQLCNGQGGSPAYMHSVPSQSLSAQTMTASAFSPTLLPCTQTFQLQPLIATSPKPQYWQRHNSPDWPPNQVDTPRSSMVSDAEDAVTSISFRSKCRHLSQELDFKPVRLPCKSGENGDTSTSKDSRQVMSRKKKRTTKEGDRSSSEESLRTSSSAGQTSKSIESSYKGSNSTRVNIGGNIGGSPLTTKNGRGKRDSPKSYSMSKSQNEHEVSRSPLNQSESSSGDDSPSQSESSSRSSTTPEVKDNEELQQDEETDDNSDEDERNLEDNGAEDKSPGDDREHQFDKDQDEDVSEDNAEEELEEEEQSSEEKAEERDSDDIIFSHPQNKVHFSPQEGFNDNDSEVGSSTGKSDEDSSELDDDDVESLLAPQTHKKISENKDFKIVVKPKNTTATKVISNMAIFQAGPQLDQQSDSDDHFYD
ncbi:protein starmaker-like isoform X2 [Corythoichthys intestinalis]|uniref:protein starmaker-like isoform X2 n=1 Tax=Corythoichthys intestinalis TaxID=161448 RepID=UPI0025A57AC2|nr:protein starmaker-like isoform X2 [Corythoichthys intestinalis]